MKFQVVKPHYGDKQYYIGDTRIVKNKEDVESLKKLGLIEDIKTTRTRKTKAQ